MSSPQYLVSVANGTAALVRMHPDCKAEDFEKLRRLFLITAKLTDKRCPSIRCDTFEETSPQGVKYREWLEGSSGAGFELLQDKSVTEQQMQETAGWLKRNRDVVHILRRHVYKYIELPQDESGYVRFT